MTPNYRAVYDGYMQSVYATLIGLALMVAIVILGWLILRVALRKNPLRELYEWLYLGGSLLSLVGVAVYLAR